MSVNKVILIGNVGRDPEIRHLDKDVVVANFTLATSESYTNRNGEKVTTTEWHNIVVWRGLAKVAEQYVKKGDKLYLEGRIRSRSWDDKDGNKRYTTEIYVDNMEMLGSRHSESYQSQAGAVSAPMQVDEKQEESDFSSSPEDDLPF